MRSGQRSFQRSAIIVFSATTLGVALAGTTLGQDSDPFGIGEPLAEAGSGVFAGPALDAVEAATGLNVTLVSDQVSIDADMMALLPDRADPTHAVICNEVDPAEDPQASVQLVDLSSGAVTDMVSGLIGCDPAKTTPWGTVIVGEEEDDGRLLVTFAGS